MESYDRFADLIARWQIPGGAVAVAKDGRLVLARGYGLAEVESNQPVRPESLFRIASISKPVTAVAILKLVEEGRLNLDDRVFCEPGRSCLLEHLQPPPGSSVDPRTYDITIRQLLQHSGGRGRGWGFEPIPPVMPWSRTMAQAVDAPEPASCETAIRYMLGQPIAFDPGSRYAYSNFGYCILGRVVEQVTGQNYEDYVKVHVLGPAGVTRMRVGATLLEGRAEGEVRYYDYPGAPLADESVFPEISGPVPWPYGGFYLEASDSAGGWIASAIDLLRFVTALDGHRSPPILRPETVQLMISRPDPPLWVGTPYYYAMGWVIEPVGDDAYWWHDGGLPGTRTLLVRRYDGLAWAALFNSRPQDSRAFFLELDAMLEQAANDVTHWPTHDLFNRYP